MLQGISGTGGPITGLNLRFEGETQHRLEAHEAEEDPRPLGRDELQAQQLLPLPPRASRRGRGVLPRGVRLAHGRLAEVIVRLVPAPLLGRRRRLGGVVGRRGGREVGVLGLLGEGARGRGLGGGEAGVLGLLGQRLGVHGVVGVGRGQGVGRGVVVEVGEARVVEQRPARVVTGRQGGRRGSTPKGIPWSRAWTIGFVGGVGRA